MSGWQEFVNLVRGWNPRVRFAAGFAVLVCVAGGSWLVLQNAAMRSRVTSLEAQHRELENRERSLQQRLSEEQVRAAGLAGQVQQQSSPEASRTPLLASLLLLPGLSRAETHAQQLVLTSSVQLAHIEIQLEPRDDYSRFRAELRTRGGDEVLIRGNLAKRRTVAGYSVSFDVPATALAAGEYELALKGITGGQATDIGYCYFGVQRK